MKKIIHYFDYKSPYAYLAQEETYQLNQETGEQVEWLPYTLTISDFLGSAELDSSGNDTIQTRNAHQWRRVKYSYMDCRREANRRGLTVRGPRKIFNSKIAHIGFLYAKRQGDFRPFHEAVYERFWKRELDIEQPELVRQVLEENGFSTTEFMDFLAKEGKEELAKIQKDAEANGVFGVPSYLTNEELFWGAERIVRLREHIGLERRHDQEH